MSTRRRVFAALVPPAELVAALADRLGPLAIPGRLVPPENWHITLRFAGQIDPVAYERWVAALDQDIATSPLTLRLGGLGAFPRPRKATVVWVGVHSERLGDLAAEVEEAAQAAGLEPEERPFRGHLTLSRVRPYRDVTDLIETEPLGLTWRVEEVKLMASEGGRYRVLEGFPLG